MEHNIINTFQEHKRRYGARRIAKSLQALSEPVSRYKASKVLGKYGLKAIQPRSFVPKTTDSRHAYNISPNLLLGRIAPSRPDEVWVGDITFIPLAGGRWCYLSVWMDLYSRKIIGWQLEDHMKEELITAAFKKALASRAIQKGIIIHSDRGGQYAGNIFRKMLSANHFVQSMSRADNPYDNAFMESCFSRLKAELIQDGLFETIEDARTEIFEYIEMYYNTIRLHSSLDYRSPKNFEEQYEKNVILKCTNKEAMLYTEESPLIERGIKPLSIKHKQEGSTLPKESMFIH
jgi:transposase InsO family protein